MLGPWALLLHGMRDLPKPGDQQSNRVSCITAGRFLTTETPGSLSNSFFLNKESWLSAVENFWIQKVIKIICNPTTQGLSHPFTILFLVFVRETYLMIILTLVKELIFVFKIQSLQNSVIIQLLRILLWAVLIKVLYKYSVDWAPLCQAFGIS